MAGIVGSKSARANAGLGNTTTVGPYTVHLFSTTGANTFTPAATGFVDILLIGGGGNGGDGSNWPAGGGAGATLFKKMIPVVAGTPYPISVGTNAANTTITYSGITTTAFAGGKGADGSGGAYMNGFPSPNASGGGGAYYGSGGTGAGVYGIGYPGGTGSAATGAGGGGAGGAGGQPSGGPGVPIAYFTGNPADIVCVGGGGGGGTAYPSYGSGGAGNNGAGRPGVAYIRYI